MKTTIDYCDRYVVCPFYLMDEKLKLRCEGYRQGVSFHTRFDNKEIKREHKRKYCWDLHGYENCPLYPVIMNQYKEDEEDE